MRVAQRNGLQPTRHVHLPHLGTARAQYDLRKMFVYLNGCVLYKPEVMLAGAGGKFDAEGRLTDEATPKFVGQQVAALRDWAVRLNR